MRGIMNWLKFSKDSCLGLFFCCSEESCLDATRWLQSCYHSCWGKVHSTLHGGIFNQKWMKWNLPWKGPVWCSNLCVADPTLLVPILVGTFFAANVWISGFVLRWLTVGQSSSGNRLAKATEHLPSRGQTIFTAVLYSISALMVKLFYDRSKHH